MLVGHTALEQGVAKPEMVFRGLQQADRSIIASHQKSRVRLHACTLNGLPELSYNILLYRQ